VTGPTPLVFGRLFLFSPYSLSILPVAKETKGEQKKKKRNSLPYIAQKDDDTLDCRRVIRIDDTVLPHPHPPSPIANIPGCHRRRAYPARHDRLSVPTTKENDSNVN
jgi:hypothetical protein